MAALSCRLAHFLSSPRIRRQSMDAFHTASLPRSELKCSAMERALATPHCSTLGRAKDRRNQFRHLSTLGVLLARSHSTARESRSVTILVRLAPPRVPPTCLKADRTLIGLCGRAERLPAARRSVPYSFAGRSRPGSFSHGFCVRERARGISVDQPHRRDGPRP